MKKTLDLGPQIDLVGFVDEGRMQSQDAKIRMDLMNWTLPDVRSGPAK